MSLHELLTRIRHAPDCEVLAPRGLPVVREEHVIPEDVREWYGLCGGISLYRKQPNRFCIVPPTEIVLANPVLMPGLSQELLASSAGDISWYWYIIAHDWGGNYLTIDLSRERLGRCYDSFFGYHAMPGYCAVVARSLTELITHLYENQKDGRYWDAPDFVSLGDSYDVIDTNK